MSGPFQYYARLTPRQKVVYRRSDALASVSLPGARTLSPLVRRVAEALERQDHDLTQAATQRLVGALADTLRVPLPTVLVLTARPHARWGELHGLYTPAGGRALAKITVWMRTARRRQVVAFRTFLRTVLHEFCHHLDYRLFGLADSFHTEGFYKRESSLIHQLTEGGTMTPIAQQMDRLSRTADDLAALLDGNPAAILTKRPAENAWAATEVVCHLRDTEELFFGRFHTILANDEPKLLAIDPDAWARNRQYLRNDARDALQSFRAGRERTLALLKTLAPEQWDRSGIHPSRGRMTVKDFVGLMAGHDDNHLDQLRRALDGRP